MRNLVAALLLLVSFACKGPDAAPKAMAHLTVHFLDQDAVVGLGRPMPGAWTFMDAGLWRDMDTVWTGNEGRAVVGRTAPHWVMLRDPDGGIHRVVLSDESDRAPSRDMPDRDQVEEQAEGMFILWVWLGHVIVRN